MYIRLPQPPPRPPGSELIVIPGWAWTAPCSGRPGSGGLTRSGGGGGGASSLILEGGGVLVMDVERAPTAKHTHMHRPLTMVTGMEIGFVQGRIRVFLKGGGRPIVQIFGHQFYNRK